MALNRANLGVFGPILAFLARKWGKNGVLKSAEKSLFFEGEMLLFVRFGTFWWVVGHDRRV